MAVKGGEGGDNRGGGSVVQQMAMAGCHQLEQQLPTHAAPQGASPRVQPHACSPQGGADAGRRRHGAHMAMHAGAAHLGRRTPPHAHTLPPTSPARPAAPSRASRQQMKLEKARA